jgi:RNA polymerase sigma factor (sigma-70 family)
MPCGIVRAGNGRARQGRSEIAHGERARAGTELVIDELVVDEIVIDQLDHAERLQVVLRSLARLSPAERDVLILRYAHELRHDEIGARVGVAAGTAQMRTSRALAALRVRMQRELSKVTPVLTGRPETAKQAPRTPERRR